MKPGAFNVFLGILAVAYPILALVLIRFLSPVWIVGVLIALLAVRLLTGWKSAPVPMLLASIAAICAMGLLSAWNSALAMRLYPVFMTGAILIAFASTLVNPPSMIERFARLAEPDLPPSGVAYTRKVTIVWCAFLALNFCVALWTALYASLELWALYNGVISYVLMGLLFAGEFLVRRKVRNAGHG